ncbi:MAG: hypothetical protein QM538_07045, partial [Methylacidiphilales bacterium]|nr:hypothetical protein [Candidatus Methylacidiphilales bacterium]
PQAIPDSQTTPVASSPEATPQAIPDSQTTPVASSPEAAPQAIPDSQTTPVASSPEAAPQNFDPRTVDLNNSTNLSEEATKDPVNSETDGLVSSDRIPINAVTRSQAEDNAQELQRINDLRSREIAIQREKIELSEKIKVEKDIDRINQLLKSEALLASREISLLEDKILFPYNSEVGVFFSVTKIPSNFSSLDSIELRLDGVLLQSQVYTKLENSSLMSGAIQKLYSGSSISGVRNLELIIRLRGENEVTTEKVFAHTFQKELYSKFIQIILDSDSITTKEW